VNTRWITPLLSTILLPPNLTDFFYLHIHSPYDEALKNKLFIFNLDNKKKAQNGNLNGFSTFVLENLFSYTKA
jgi:hypothetical protein